MALEEHTFPLPRLFGDCGLDHHNHLSRARGSDCNAQSQFTGELCFGKRYNGLFVPEEPEKPNPILSLLSQAGLSSDFVQKIRFRGPVGKIALVGVILLPSLGGIGIRSSNPGIQGLCAVLATVVGIFVVGGILWYSDKHPDQATLEGMEVVVMQHQKAWAEAAAKGVPGLPAILPTIPNLESARPEIE